MSIYKSFVDQDELSKIICMKKYLGFTDDEIEENFKMLAKEKQLIAIADWLADKISDDNPPVGYESPIKLKSDLEAEEKINGAKKPDTGENSDNVSEESTSTEDSGSSGDTGSGETESPSPESENSSVPDFGLS
jgi:hypothetical protein